MKKAKIMLTTIAIIASVSGSLAFKAYHKNIALNYAYWPFSGNLCVEGTTTGTTITTSSRPGFLTATFKGTLDLNAIGQDCVNRNPPCTTTIYYKTALQN